MLNNSFFRFSAPVTEDGLVKSAIEINPDHEIFQGHFPGQPVVPGVCMIRMVQEVCAQVTGRNIRLKRADNLKFLALLDPRENGLANMELKFAGVEDKELRVESRIFNSANVFFKFKGTFIFL